MSDVGAVSGSYNTRIETHSTQATGGVAAEGPTVDVSASRATEANPAAAPPLRSPSKYEDVAAINSAMEQLGVSIETVFGLFAVMMEQVQNELARTAKDVRDQQVQEVKQEKLAAADKQREGALYSLIGTETMAGAQGASAMINIGGGVKGMQLTTTSASSAPSAGESVAEAEVGTGNAAETATSGTGESLGSTSEIEAEIKASNMEPEASPTEEAAADVQEEAADYSKTTKASRLAHQDATESARLSARAQNIALLTQGLSGLATSGGQAVQGALQYEADLKKAEATEAEARSDEHQAALQRAQSEADSMQRGVDSMISTYQQVMENKAQTDRQIWSQA